MEVSTQHLSNRRSATDSFSHPFRNDLNNVSALQDARRQKKLLEEAARLQQEKLGNAIKDKESLRQNRDELLAEKQRLEEATTGLQTRINNLTIRNNEQETKVDCLEGSVNQLQAKLRDFDAEKEGFRQETTDLRTRINNITTSYEAQVTETKGQLSEKARNLESALQHHPPLGDLVNCLPAKWHEATVHIINARSLMAMDAGKDDCQRVHLWDFQPDNQNQIFKIRKINNDLRPQSAWVIRRKDNEKRFYFPKYGAGSDDDVQVGLIDSAPGSQDYWWIGRTSGSRIGTWQIQNVEWGTNLEARDTSKDTGTRVLSYSPADRWDSQWLIIPIEVPT